MHVFLFCFGLIDTRLIKLSAVGIEPETTRSLGRTLPPGYDNMQISWHDTNTEDHFACFLHICNVYLFTFAYFLKAKEAQVLLSISGHCVVLLLSIHLKSSLRVTDNRARLRNLQYWCARNTYAYMKIVLFNAQNWKLLEVFGNQKSLDIFIFIGKPASANLRAILWNRS